MNHELIEQVLSRVQQQLPRALLIGREPPCALGWQYVSEAPYAAVVIGSMDACALLHFPDPVCANALLAGIPVYLWREGLSYRAYAKTANRVLWGRLLAAERQLGALGVQLLRPAAQGIVTAETVRRRLREGLPVEGRLTPLARDILEGRA